MFDFDKVDDPSCWDIISAMVDGFSASLDLLHINPNLEALKPSTMPN